jgi:hypothetical protein
MARAEAHLIGRQSRTTDYIIRYLGTKVKTYFSSRS